MVSLPRKPVDDERVVVALGAADRHLGRQSFDDDDDPLLATLICRRRRCR